MDEKGSRQLFRDNSNCYTECDYGSYMQNEPAIDEDTFIELARKLHNVWLWDLVELLNK